MKDFLKGVGNSAKGAVESGIYVFCLVVAVGLGWSLGRRVVNKVEKRIEEKE